MSEYTRFELDLELIRKYFVIDESSPSGLRWAVKHYKFRPGNIAGILTESGSKGYGKRWEISIKSHPRQVSRVVWSMANGPIPDGMTVDHLDGNPRNNSVSNLSLKTHGHNVRARSKRKNHNNTSGYSGVSRNRNLWRARVMRHGEVIFNQCFRGAEEAARARDEVIKKWSTENNEEYRLYNFT